MVYDFERCNLLSLPLMTFKNKLTGLVSKKSFVINIQYFYPGLMSEVFLNLCRHFMSDPKRQMEKLFETLDYELISHFLAYYLVEIGAFESNTVKKAIKRQQNKVESFNAKINASLSLLVDRIASEIGNEHFILEKSPNKEKEGENSDKRPIISQTKSEPNLGIKISGCSKSQPLDSDVASCSNTKISDSTSKENQSYLVGIKEMGDETAESPVEVIETSKQTVSLTLLPCI